MTKSSKITDTTTLWNAHNISSKSVVDIAKVGRDMAIANEVVRVDISLRLHNVL